jgi:quercetin dioxygenase-like cupin family protein
VKLYRWDEGADGPLGEATMRAKLERLGYSVSRYVYPPGTFFDVHTHAVDKIDAVLAGRFRIVLEGQAVVLEPGDAVEVPRGARHSAEVVGDESVVSLDAIRR